MYICSINKLLTCRKVNAHEYVIQDSARAIDLVGLERSRAIRVVTQNDIFMTAIISDSDALAKTL